jgi:hypothetical protein
MPRLRRKDTDNLCTIFPNQEERVGRINHNAPPLLLCAGPSWEIEIVSDHVHPNTLLQFAPGILRSPYPGVLFVEATCETTSLNGRAF